MIIVERRDGMDRSELRKCLEYSSFELRATETLPVEQRYIVNTQDGEQDGCTVYQILGSKGARYTISSSYVIPPQPFLILRMISAQPSEHVYKAISISALENLCEVQ